jgi:antitoxin (DNA-binding transcriptional repressor) of toxin-antitoxin stability system
MPTITAAEARDRLRELMQRAASGEDVMIVGDDGLAVRLVPLSGSGIPRFGSARGLFSIGDDFDHPLEDFAAYEARPSGDT